MNKHTQRLLLATALAFLLPSALAACSGNRGDESQGSGASSSRGGSSAAKRVFSVRLVSEGRTYEILSVEEGGAAPAVVDPERDGYAFGGWYLDEGVWSVPFDGSSVAGDVAAYAKWSPIEYSIDYDLGGGAQNADNPVSYTVESDSLSLHAPLREGYSFLGWRKDGNFVSSIDPRWLGDVSLEAVWEAVSYSISYHLDGGENGASNPFSYTIESDPITLSAPSKAGYDFGGWYSDASFENAVDSIGKGSLGDRELYAKWSPISYPIDYDLGGGAQNDGNPLSYTVESGRLPLYAPSRAGYEFMGWRKEGDFVSSIEPYWLSDVSLVAVWEAEAYPISYHLDGGQNEGNPMAYTVESDPITLSAPSKAGYTFEGWYSDPSFKDRVLSVGGGAMGGMDLYAKWSPTAYSITYKGPEGEDLDAVGAGLPSSYTVEDDDLPLGAYALKGYRFESWMRNGLTVSHIPAGSTGDIVLQGRFEDTFSIRYVDEAFGKTNPSNPDFFSAGMEPIKLAPLEDAVDYNFAGWADEGGNKVTSVDTSAGDDLTLYATWERKLGFEDFDYIVDEGRKACVLTGVKDKTVARLEIPDVFTGIKPGALAGLSDLEDLTLPYIGYDEELSKNSVLAYLFGYSSNELAGGGIPSSLKKVRVKGGDLGQYAFANLANVEEIVIDPEVENIGYYAFYNCSSLSELTMPVRNIPTEELESKVVPWSTRPASSAQYYGIAGSANARIPYDKDKLLTVHLDGGDNGKGFSMFDYCLGLGKVTIDNTNIHKSMFAYCKNLTEVTIGNNVEEIHAASFSTCTSLTEIVIPDSVKGLGKFYTHAEVDGIRLGSSSGSMFYGTPITKAVIGNGTEIIPSNMFYGNSIKEITIGEKVRYVANRALYLPYGNTLPDDFTLINNSKQKTWIMSGELDVKFIKAVLASENAPERICYVSYDKDFNAEVAGTPSTYKDNTNYQYFVSIYGDKLDESEKKKFVFYSKNDPYAEGGVASTDNADIEYWHHEEGDDWYFRTYCVTPVIWPKP